MKFLLTICLLIPFHLSAKITDQTGMVQLPVLDKQGVMKVWYQLPDRVTKATPIIFVMHGVRRNADEYRDAWITLAKERQYIIVVPEFDRDRFPGARGYNLGNLVAENGTPNPESEWSFSVIERVFEAIKLELDNHSDQFYIFGHSAGAQFVHRLLMFKPNLPVQLAIAANAGWYTLPNKAQTFPYGLGRIDVRPVNVADYLAKPMVILLGDQDIDPKDPNLRTTPEANEQGPHRFARGQNYYNQAKTQAKSDNLAFNWRIKVAPGVAHDNRMMAPFAADIISQSLVMNKGIK